MGLVHDDIIMDLFHESGTQWYSDIKRNVRVLFVKFDFTPLFTFWFACAKACHKLCKFPFSQAERTLKDIYICFLIICSVFSIYSNIISHMTIPIKFWTLHVANVKSVCVFYFTGNDLGEWKEHVDVDDFPWTPEVEAYLNTITPGTVLAFITGSSKVPCMGFLPAPHAEFTTDEQRNLPCASTCSNLLYLPANQKTEIPDLFCRYFVEALMGGGDYFGKI